MTEKIGFNPEHVLYEADDRWYPEYHLKVIDTGKSTGKLTVTFHGKGIYAQIVPLSYGAQYGADGFDIEAWAHISCQVVDQHLWKNRGITPQPPQ